MVATVFYLLKLQKYISSKEKILKQKNIHWICPNGYVYEFSVDYDIIEIGNIIDIHKYLMKKHDIKQCLELLKICLLNY